MESSAEEQDRWLTVEQVSELLQVNQETVRRWIRSGELPVLDLGGPKTGYRILRRELDAYIKSRYGPVGKSEAVA